MVSMFYPLGFPAQMRTNSAAVLSMFERAWGVFERRFETEPVSVDVHVVESDSEECPPQPGWSLMPPLYVSTANASNYSVADLERNRTQMTISRAAERHPLYLRYFLLDAAPLVHIAFRYGTPIHAACVSLDGHGVLLCGESGAGKSTLSYACARSGWTFTSDDSGYLVHGRDSRLLTGNCYQVRFRPAAQYFFPEINGREVTPRAGGKPSIEALTATLPGIACSPDAEIGSIVFLNRRSDSRPRLATYSKELARQYLRQSLFGWGDYLDLQHEAIERLLQLEVLELRYSQLDWAVERLAMLAQAGR